jgi:hypothetical protein
MDLAASAPLRFAQEDYNASHETAIIPVTVIAAVSATVAVIGVAVARTRAGAAMKSAFVAADGVARVAHGRRGGGNPGV